MLQQPEIHVCQCINICHVSVHVLVNAHSIISLINRSIRYNLSSSTIVHYTLLWRGTNVQFKPKIEQEPVITESKSSLQRFFPQVINPIATYHHYHQRK